MEPIILASLAACLSLLMAVAWGVQRVTKNSGWVDVIWSAAVGIVGVIAALLPSSGSGDHRPVAVAILIAAWSARLASHIAGRAIKGEDDPRYADMAATAGKSWPIQLFLFLQIQAAAAFVLVVAVRSAATRPGDFPSWTDVAGALLVIIAIAGEGIADAQLKRFARIHKDEKTVCDVGLWRYSRHPNYFFQWLGWCALAIIAIDTTGAFPWGWIALAAPVLMYILLVYASGIPPLEQHMLRSRGDAFRAYQARTSAFFPAPPRQNKDFS